MTKIAYLDDDQIQHLLVRKLIKIHLPNCTSEFFSEPESLEAWLNNNPVDLIISDINFGDSSGWDWVEIFSAKTAAPIVFVTASCLPEDRRKINEFSEVRGVFEKPISEADWRRLAELIAEIN